MFNNCAFSLDLEQEGPLEESYGYWINLFSDLSIRGLVNRGLNEEKYFEDFHGRVLDHGPFSLQIQSYESKNHS